MKYLILTFLFLFGCRAPGLPITKGHELVVVVPHNWMDSAKPYIDYKKEKGFSVTVVDMEDVKATGDIGQWGDNLRYKLISLHPDYVFLMGDVSVIPTIYSCSDVSSWSKWTDQSCIYSDFLLSVADDNLTVLFPVGRLMAKEPSEIDNYLFKAKNYDNFFGRAAGAYLINDRAYEANDFSILGLEKKLQTAGIVTAVQVLNTDKDKPSINNLTEATYTSLHSAVSNDVGFIMYYGHGSSWGWGYHWNLLWPYLTFEESKPIPLVYAMACETALGAPNPPWYPYYDSLGIYRNFSGVDHVSSEDLGTIGSLQFHEPYDVISDSIAHHFTSTEKGGAMVYIGETVVTHAEANFNNAFYDELIKAAKNGVETIGDIWYNTIENMLREPTSKDVHPVFFQFVGDPSTSFPKIVE